MPCLAVLNKKFLDRDLGGDDLQNVDSSSFSTDASVVKFSRRSVRGFYVKLLTDRQTNAGHYIAFLPEVNISECLK